MTGTIYNIQNFSVHDGPGIRTTVFFKGCPLRCKWCHNPESISFKKELVYRKEKCIDCDECEGLLEKAELCPAEAKKIYGQDYSVEEILKEVNKDKIFYDESGGGVTISGGEPFGQIDFLLELLIKLKENDIHVTIDTSGFTKWENIEKTLKYVDLFLYDIKGIDKERHIENTGVDNTLIIDNLYKLSLGKEKYSYKIWVRLPIIPEVNWNKEEMDELGKQLEKLKIDKVNLLPYHNISAHKYHDLNIEYRMKDIDEPDKDYMEKIKIQLVQYNLEVKVGG